MTAATFWTPTELEAPPTDKPFWAYLHQTGVHQMVPTRTEAGARALFERAKADLAEPDDGESDFIVDLMIQGDCDCDFRMNRQMLDRLKALPADGDLSRQEQPETVVNSTIKPSNPNPGSEEP